jgi:hypothetical protein
MLFIFSTATMVTWTRLNITLYVYYLCCLTCCLRELETFTLFAQLSIFMYLSVGYIIVHVQFLFTNSILKLS